jgi:hypothetical protein
VELTLIGCHEVVKVIAAALDPTLVEPEYSLSVSLTVAPSVSPRTHAATV